MRITIARADADGNALAALRRRQPRGGHGDDDCVVARERHVNQHDLQERDAADKSLICIS